MRFPGAWKDLGGLRVSPYSCDFGAKWQQIHTAVRITDRHGKALETITAKAMKTATNVIETNIAANSRPYSITSSAMASRVGAIWRLSVFAP
jgi:hypothetical protein